MRTSETTGALVKAMAQAQAEMKNASMNKENPHFRSKYADLSAVRDATVPALGKHGLAIIQVTGFSADHGLVLYTRLSHADGEWLEAEYPLVVGNPQQMGSALTYARRYCWAAICGIAADEDDDANGAGEARPQSERKPTQLLGVKESPGGHTTGADSGHWLPAAGGPAASTESPGGRTKGADSGQGRRAAGGPAASADKSQEAHDRFMTALDKTTNIGSAAELDARLRKARSVLGEFYGECVAAMQAKVSALTGNAHPQILSGPDPLDDTDAAIADLESVGDERQGEI